MLQRKSQNCRIRSQNNLHIVWKKKKNTGQTPTLKKKRYAVSGFEQEGSRKHKQLIHFWKLNQAFLFALQEIYTVRPVTQSCESRSTVVTHLHQISIESADWGNARCQRWFVGSDRKQRRSACPPSPLPCSAVKWLVSAQTARPGKGQHIYLYRN